MNTLDHSSCRFLNHVSFSSIGEVPTKPKPVLYNITMDNMKIIFNPRTIKALSSITDEAQESVTDLSTCYDTAAENDADESLSSSDERIESAPASPQSVLIIGATGKTGIQILKSFANYSENARPLIFGLTRNLRTIKSDTMELYQRFGEGLIEGDPTKAADIHRALLISNADTIVMSVGSGNNRKSNVRTQSAISLAQVLRHPPFAHVHTIVVSRTIAEGHRVHFGLHKLVEKSLRSIVQDHAGQERVFLTDATIRARSTIVRPTNLTSQSTANQKRPTTITTFTHEDNNNHKTLGGSKTSRYDLAAFLVEEAISQHHKGHVINVASVRSHGQ